MLIHPYRFDSRFDDVMVCGNSKASVLFCMGVKLGHITVRYSGTGKLPCVTCTVFTRVRAKGSLYGK